MKYPVTIEKVDKNYVASISHKNGRFQGACEGSSRKDTIEELAKLVAAMVASAINDGEEVPTPASCDSGNFYITLPLMISAKAMLHNEWLKSGKRKADIARAMHMNQRQVDRIFDPAHRSTIGQLEQAALVFGKRMNLGFA